MRLIDADALMKLVTVLEVTQLNSLLSDVKCIIRDTPTIKERKHGHWIGKRIAGYGTVRCSVCKSKFTNNAGQWNYCPSCGATMDEEVKADE